MKNLSFFLLLFLVALSACRKDINEVTTEVDTPTPPFLEGYTPNFSLANGDLTGFVIDENQEPVAGAEVTLGNFMTTTDQFGHFFFTNADMNAKGTVVQVKKEGYFLGSRRFQAVENVENRVQIELITKNFAQSFESGPGGTINLQDGGTIVFAPESIRKADGTLYNGLVNVAAFWLDPTDYRTFSQMPGNLFGVDNQGEEVVLGTMGMLAVELESEAGEPLNIAEGKTATIKTPIPESLLNVATEEIPLWSYNEEFGVWVEEGVSRLTVDGFYEAEVTHFSYWNHDFKDPVIEFTGMVTNDEGVALENYGVIISLQNSSSFGSGRTCDDGTIAGLIPEGYLLDFQIMGICGEILYSETIGPFSGFADLGTIVVPESILNSTTVIGTLVDCDGNTFADALLFIDVDNSAYYNYLDNGDFEFTFTTCSSSGSVNIIGYDLDNFLQSDPISVPSGETTDVGDVAICDVTLTNYLAINVDGTEHTFLDLTIEQVTPDSTEIDSNSGATGSISLKFDGIEPGNYAAGLGGFIYYNQNDWNLGWTPGMALDVFEITEYGDVGEPIIGNFSGEMNNYGAQPNELVTVSGNFNIIRQE